MEKFVTAAIAMFLVREVEPYMAEPEVKRVCENGGMTIAHGCKLSRAKRGEVMGWKVSGYSFDGSDLSHVMHHASKQPCQECERLDRMVMAIL